MTIELMRCLYCLLQFEGVHTDICPRCHQHFIKVSARYPSLKERIYEETENDEPRYIR